MDDVYEELPEDEQELILYMHYWASGMTHTRAAVNLLTEAHQHTFSRLLGDPQVRQHLRKIRGKEIVTVDWTALGGVALRALAHELELPARSAQMCLIACELAATGCDSGQPLTELLSGLDTMHTQLVLRAIQVHQGLAVQPTPDYVKN